MIDFYIKRSIKAQIFLLSTGKYILMLRQTKGLLYKNFLLHKASPLSTLLIFLLPIAVAAILIPFRYLIPIQKIQGKSFGQNNQLKVSLYGNPLVPYVLKQIPSLYNGCPSDTMVALGPPDHPLINKTVDYLKTLTFHVELFNSNEEINSHIESEQYGQKNKKICFAVFFQGESPNYIYHLRYNISEKSIPDPEKAYSSKFFHYSQMKKYFLSGALGVTAMVNNIIFNQEIFKSYLAQKIQKTIFQENLLLGSIPLEAKNQQYLDNPEFILNTTMFPIYQEPTTIDQFYFHLYSTSFFILLLPLAVIYARQTEFMLYEKQAMIQQNLLIMGMKLPSYYLSWILFYFLFYLLINLSISTLIALKFKYAKFWIIFLAFLLIHCFLIIQSIFIQIFVKKAKIGMIVALVFFILQFLMIFFVTSNQDIQSNVLNYASISPFVAAGLIFRTVFYTQSFDVPFQFGRSYEGYQLSTPFISLAINLVVWIFLTIMCQLAYNLFRNFNCISDKQNPVALQGQQQRNDKKQTQRKLSDKYAEVSQNEKYVKVKNVSKVYDRKIKALDNISFTLQKNTITLLLGQNGAGKSTLISLLTGIHRPTQGSIKINQRHQIAQIRKKLGFCPQSNSLYENLSVEAHLYIYGCIKNCSALKIKEQSQHLLEDVELSEKAEQKVQNLSGGQKRRLSAAISLLGRPDLVILDEPTTGMDINSRKKLWEVLQKHSSGKCIFLTSHSLQEEDINDEKVIVLSQGKILASCHINDFRSNFGNHHKLTILFQSVNLINGIILYMKRNMKAAEVFGIYEASIDFLLPQEITVLKIKQFLEKLQRSKQNLGILEFFIASLTLEEIYLRALDQENNHVKTNTFPRLTYQQSNRCKFTSHFKSLLLKRVNINSKHMKTIIGEIFLPILILTFAFVIIRGNFDTSYKTHLSQLSLHSRQNLDMYTGFTASQQYFKDQVQDLLDTVKLHVLEKVTNIYSERLKLHIFDNIDLKDFDKNVLLEKKLFEPDFQGGIYLGTPKLIGNKIILSSTALVNPKSTTSTFSTQSFWVQTLLNTLTDSNVSITVLNNPLPYLQSERNDSFSQVKTFLTILVIVLVISLYFSSIASFIAKQRIKKILFHQVLSGMSRTAYFFSNFLFDLILCQSLMLVFLLFCYAFQLRSLISPESISYTCAIIFLFPFAYIPFTYLICKLLTTFQSAQGYIFYFTVIFGGILPQILAIFRLIEETGFSSVPYHISWIFRLVPVFSFGEGLANLACLEMYNAKRRNFYIDDKSIAIIPIIFIGSLSVLYVLLSFLSAKFSLRQLLEKLFVKNPKIEEIKLRDNAQKRKQAALQSSPQDFPILLKNLKKVYFRWKETNLYVLKGVSVGIKKGAVFGLLGLNGAGKTTTFKILTRQILPTSGDIYILGEKKLSIGSSKIGYCPQIDPLNEELNVLEHLHFYTCLKGIDSQEISKTVSSLIKLIGLQKYANTPACHLSGGNKRKLSLAIAILGNPEIILMDEPSSGMDPVSKRFIWNFISQLSQKENPTILLTSHSMQEIEKVTSEVGIMEDGNFGLIEQTQKLLIHSKEFQVRLKLQKNNEKLKQFQPKKGLKADQDTSIFVKKICEKFRFHQEICKNIVLEALEKEEDMNMELIEKIEYQELKLEVRKVFPNSHFMQEQRGFCSFEVNQEELSNIFELVHCSFKTKFKIAYYEIRKSNFNSIFRQINAIS